MFAFQSTLLNFPVTKTIDINLRITLYSQDNLEQQLLHSNQLIILNVQN